MQEKLDLVSLEHFESHSVNFEELWAQAPCKSNNSDWKQSPPTKLQRALGRRTT